MDAASGPVAAQPRTGAGRPVGDRLARATDLLRQHTDAGWTAIEAGVLTRAMAAFRPSAPVRGRHQHGAYFVAADVLVTRLRQDIDVVPGAAAQSITCTTGEGDVLEQVVVQLVAAFGAPLLELAEEVHAIVVGTLGDLLGSLAPAAERVHTHVHIGDVSNDPRVVD